jgi:very-short-patch-repair endonuclease
MVSEHRRFARSLRKQSTRAEEILWRRLRASRFHGAKFRRQVPLDRYVVDFYCHAAKLIVEIDGKQHEWQSGYDDGRTEELQRLGLRIMRLANEEICGDLDAALERIRVELRLPFL